MILLSWNNFMDQAESRTHDPRDKHSHNLLGQPATHSKRIIKTPNKICYIYGLLCGGWWVGWFDTERSIWWSEPQNIIEEINCFQNNPGPRTTKMKGFTQALEGKEDNSRYIYMYTEHFYYYIFRAAQHTCPKVLLLEQTLDNARQPFTVWGSDTRGVCPVNQEYFVWV